MGLELSIENGGSSYPSAASPGRFEPPAAARPGRGWIVVTAGAAAFGAAAADESRGCAWAADRGLGTRRSALPRLGLTTAFVGTACCRKSGTTGAGGMLAGEPSDPPVGAATASAGQAISTSRSGCLLRRRSLVGSTSSWSASTWCPAFGFLPRTRTLVLREPIKLVLGSSRSPSTSPAAVAPP